MAENRRLVCSRQSEFKEHRGRSAEVEPLRPGRGGNPGATLMQLQDKQSVQIRDL